MNESRRVAVAELRDIVSDTGELSKGTRIADEGGLLHLSRFEHKLFADALGSGSAPYKVQIVFENKLVRGRCSCMAARSRPFCKHAAGLLVAWARAPESFAEASLPPPGALPAGTKPKDVKKGKVDAKDLMRRGVEQVTTLVRELTASGVASLASDRAEQVRALGEGLREAKLRRLSGRTIELSSHLARAATRSESFDSSSYAELVGDLLLTARKLEKYIGGDPLQDEHVEELIGKVWTKKDRKPVEGLKLVEYAYLSRTTPDRFLIRESRFVDLITGEHFSEKQILPEFLVKRTEPKVSWAGKLLEGVSGSLYPTFSPRRLDIEDPGKSTALTAAALVELLDRALPSVSAALAALQERRKDVFAPDALPVLLRVDSIVASGQRLQAVDASDAALFLPDDARAEEALARVLRESRLEAILGDVALDGALPTLFPLAAVVRSSGQLSLARLGIDAATLLEGKKLRAQALATQRASRWVDVARQVGASGAAVALGEVRDEMAEALCTGLSTVDSRFADPLVSRLRDLGLGKQADLLAAIAVKSQAEDKLDDFIRLHQVLGIGLSRLAGAMPIDRSQLEPVPTYESVHVRRPDRALLPHQVAALQGSRHLNRYEAAVHYARHYEGMTPDELAKSIYPTWADGSASLYVARAFAKMPNEAVQAARGVLESNPRQRWRARVAKLTAIRVLETIGTEDAKELLISYARGHGSDETSAAHARRALIKLGVAKEPHGEREEMEELIRLALSGSQKEQRSAALKELAKRGFVDAIPAMRASFEADVSADVREVAAHALAEVGDVESVEAFIRLLQQRADRGGEAKVGAHALGILGDARGIDELLRAYVEGWQPGIIAAALRQVGPAALEPLVQAMESNPEIVERKAALGIVAAIPIPMEDVEELLKARLNTATGAADFCERAGLYLTIASALPPVASAIAKHIGELRPSILEKKPSSAEKALARKCAKYA